MLTERASWLLSTLERRPAIPTREVEAIVRGQGAPCPEVWLAFHDRFTGYVEIFGRDSAVWGLAHEESCWLGPRGIHVEQDDERENRWAILCADVHPTYGYMLDDEGGFVGHGQHESFEVHVEQLAALRAFGADGDVRRLLDEIAVPGARESVLAEVQPFAIAEASDRYTRCFLSPRYFVREGTSGAWLQVWERPPR